MHGWYVYACVCGAFTNSTLIIITPLHNTLTIGPAVLRVGLQCGHEAVFTQFTDSTVLMILFLYRLCVECAAAFNKKQINSSHLFFLPPNLP